jgi:hypothetical protein
MFVRNIALSVRADLLMFDELIRLEPPFLSFMFSLMC